MEEKNPHEVARSISEGAALVVFGVILFMAVAVVGLVAGVLFLWLIELAGRLAP